ncbi:hypothetical protein [Burkholderia vietnamiensis]|uniref:hypothetical protein n=1 Tax=Burkholderia vietnamiensis TaxID=60552 RepID=UPI0015889BAE|nr:hypothetical protein [Burkholderia vietnamiensis]
MNRSALQTDNGFAPVRVAPKKRKPRWVARFDAICTVIMWIVGLPLFALPMIGRIPRNAVHDVLLREGAVTLLGVGNAIDDALDPLNGLLTRNCPPAVTWFSGIPEAITQQIWFGSLGITLVTFVLAWSVQIAYGRGTLSHISIASHQNQRG